MHILFCLDKSESCNPIGSVNTSINHCECKSRVTGHQCDQCKTGTFYLNTFTPEGCIECYCSGLTRSCTSASNLYRDNVELKMDQYIHGVILRDLPNITIIKDEMSFDHINNELIYRDFTFQNDLYWQLPNQFLGNKITSYGGYLNYTFRFEGNHFSSDDQIPTAMLIGKNISLAYYYKASLRPFVVNTISIALNENFWSFTSGQQAQRKDLMFILNNLQAILLRATPSNDVILIGLLTAKLDTTVERLMNYFPNEHIRALTVEECDCPPGYMGTSCEKCSPGYKVSKHKSGNNYLFRFTCVPCFCNGHSNECDPETGVCIVSLKFFLTLLNL